jgi:hypothetical protein
MSDQRPGAPHKLLQSTCQMRWGGGIIRWILCLLFSGTCLACSAQDGDGRWLEPVITERWPEGGVKQTQQHIVQGYDSQVRTCFIDGEGRELGCGVFHWGKPWSGLFVEWFDDYGEREINQGVASPAGADSHGHPVHPRIIRSFREGMRHGVWTIYWETGKPQNKLSYEDGKLVHRSIHGPDGKFITEETY